MKDIKKCGNYVSLRFMDYNIKIQFEISITKPFGRVKWLNMNIDCNGKIETECVLVYPIEENGVIQDGERVYNLSVKVNTFLVNGMLSFLKELEEKNANKCSVSKENGQMKG
jgi:hypothetical protein